MSEYSKSPVKKVACVVVVLVAAVGVGVVVREYRLRSYLEKHEVEASKAVEPAKEPVVRQVSNGPELQYTPEQIGIEDVNVQPEPPSPEPTRAPIEIAVEDNRVDVGVGARIEAEPVENKPDVEDSAVKEKRAREALSWIGYDTEADRVWIEVINDPTVSANARSNLIEDLNEDGFADPHNTTMDDLPVIEYRIQLIEDLAPYAMDKVNADAFAEAHKDLVNMANRLRR